jgi:hypothetical protein
MSCSLTLNDALIVADGLLNGVVLYVTVNVENGFSGTSDNTVVFWDTDGDGDARMLKPGDGLLIPPATPHAGGKPGAAKSRILITLRGGEGQAARLSGVITRRRCRCVSRPPPMRG